MDAFFASVELLDHPEWRGKPVIVGSGPHERGVVSTCSYEARRFGVHSAMPSRTAYALCPHAIFTYPNMARYQEVSDKAFEVFGRYSPYVEGVSVDEAFLDISGSLHLYKRGDDAASSLECARRLGEALRTEVKRECGVTCSVGIAPNRLLAKIGSEEHKPDGLTMMPFEPEAIAAFLAPKPIGILWGVGKSTIEALKPYGITSCGDVQRLVKSAECRVRSAGLGKLIPEGLVECAFGRCDDTVYWEESAEKSVSREYTFDEDEPDREKVRAKLLELVGEVGQRFRRDERWATTARIKVRDADFNTFTRQLPFPMPSRDDIAFRRAALELFEAAFPSAPRTLHPAPRTLHPAPRTLHPAPRTLHPAPRTLHPAPRTRLIGFGVTGFVDSPEVGDQLSLFENPEEKSREKHERLSLVMDTLRDRGFEFR